jgi:hypothetical protein
VVKLSVLSMVSDSGCLISILALLAVKRLHFFEFLYAVHLELGHNFSEYPVYALSEVSDSSLIPAIALDHLRDGCVSNYHTFIKLFATFGVLRGRTLLCRFTR